MKFKYFGDSYDIIKKSLIAWLGEFGDWRAHPMFTEPVAPDQAELFARFLSAALVSNEELTPRTDRATYFSPCRSAGNLFLDPDTGISLAPRRGSTSINYVFGPELIELSRERPESLTLVFDQSYSRGNQKQQIQAKLAFFATYDVHGFAYWSHATFVVLGANVGLVVRAHDKLLEVSGLPQSRLITVLDCDTR
jgi:hypothetical protein